LLSVPFPEFGGGGGGFATRNRKNQKPEKNEELKTVKAIGYNSFVYLDALSAPSSSHHGPSFDGGEAKNLNED